MSDHNNFDTIYSRFALVEEAYSILHSAFTDMMDSPLSQFQLQNVDYMDMILEKFNIIKNTKNIDTDQLEELKQVESDLYVMIGKFFNSKHTANLELYDGNQKYLLNTIYKYFFYNKLNTMVTYVTNYIKLNIEYFISLYKNDTKKDLVFSQIKSELNIKNVSLYPIIINYEEIVSSIITNENISICDMIELSDLEVEEMIMLLSIFEDSDGCVEYKQYMEGFNNSFTFNEALPLFRNSIFELIKTL